MYYFCQMKRLTDGTPFELLREQLQVRKWRVSRTRMEHVLERIDQYEESNRMGGHGVSQRILYTAIVSIWASDRHKRLGSDGGEQGGPFTRRSDRKRVLTTSKTTALLVSLSRTYCGQVSNSAFRNQKIDKQSIGHE